eukprot:gene18669-20554_t
MRVLDILLLFIPLVLPCALAKRRRELGQDGPKQEESSEVTFEKSEPLYTNQWVVHIKDGVKKAEEVAHKHGFKFHGQISSLEDFYLFEHSNIHKRSRRSLEHHELLNSDPIVHWAEQQKILKRVKRGFEDFTDPLFKDQWYLKNRAIAAQAQQNYEKIVDIAGSVKLISK